jgi:hypothetical protein
MKVIIFLLINFVVAFISDIVLNDLAVFYKIIPSLQPYYKNHSLTESGVLASLTIVVALIITMLISKLLLNIAIPTNINKLGYFALIAFVVGYIIDIIIYKQKIFGNRLDEYYKTFGAGFWGATAFVFSVVVSFFIQKIILRIL